MLIVIAIYVAAALLLALYGFNSWILTGLYFKNRHRSPAPSQPESDLQDLPPVTVQLPIFNEALVVERLIDAAANLAYPRHLLQIQVLDDSTDETTEIALQCVKKYRRRGLNIGLVRRRHRRGFKAGALKHGLKKASGQFIAIFDADFVPEPDFLKQTIPHLVRNPQLGFLQARWGHINDSYSTITLAQALAIDGHFVVEQTARNTSGLLMNFNGTAGVWRRDCIEAAGGWQADTICEDFDLSYRAQLAGWQPLFLPHVSTPAEIPPQMAAYKRQQFRWAKGSIQCLKKLVGQVWRSTLPLFTKFQATFHMSNYLVHPLIVVVAVLTPILIVSGSTQNIRFPLIYLSLASLGPPTLFAVAQISLHKGRWMKRYKSMPILILIGSGIALSNSKAVLEALFGVGNNFRRTPKFNIKSSADCWQNSVYRLPLNAVVLGELVLAIYFVWGAWVAAVSGNQLAIPFILLYAFSFGYVGWQGLWDARRELRSWLKRTRNHRLRRQKLTRRGGRRRYLDAFE